MGERKGRVGIASTILICSFFFVIDNQMLSNIGGKGGRKKGDEKSFYYI